LDEFISPACIVFENKIFGMQPLKTVSLFSIVWFVILKLIMLCSENELIFFFIVKDVHIVSSY